MFFGPKVQALGVFVGATLFFAAGAGARGLWRPDEPRYAEVARVMATPGGDWVVPHLDGRIYDDKPPGSFWLVAATHRYHGIDIALAAKLPSILGGAAAVLATFLLGLRLYGSAGVGLAAATVAATCLELGWLSRRANLDALLTGITSLSFYCFARGYLGGDGGPLTPTLSPPGRGRHGVGRKEPWYALAFLLAGLGVLVKGPVALAVPGIAALATVLVLDGPRSLVSRRLIWGIPLALLPASVWLAVAWARAGEGYVRAAALGQGVGHALGKVDQQRPFWFYLEAFPEGFLPYTVLLPAAIYAFVRWRRPEERRADTLVACFTLAPFLLLSCFPAKRSLYLLPIYPAAAQLVARLLPAAVRNLRHPVVAWSRYSFAGGTLVLGLATAAAGVLFLAGADGFAAERLRAWAHLRPYATSVHGILAASLGIVAALDSALALAGRGAVEAAGGIGAAAVALSLAVFCVAFPIADPDLSQRDFLDAVAIAVGESPVGSYGRHDFTVNLRLERDVVPSPRNPADAARFLAGALPGTAFLVAEREELDEKGWPSGAHVVLEWPRTLRSDLILLSNRAGSFFGVRHGLE